MVVQQITKKLISRPIPKPSRNLLEIYDETDFVIMIQRKSWPVAPSMWPNREISILYVLYIFVLSVFKHIWGVSGVPKCFYWIVARCHKSDQCNWLFLDPPDFQSLNWKHTTRSCTYVEFKSKKSWSLDFIIIKFIQDCFS